MTGRKKNVQRKSAKKRIRNPIKIAALIISAIQDLRETKGSTPRKIIGYINYVSDMTEDRVKRRVKSVLKRGVEYGILRRHRGQYFLPTTNELDRANRIALRFAKLPLPPAYSTKSNSPSSSKNKSSASQRKSNKSSKSPKAGRFAKTREILMPSAVTASGGPANISDT